MNTIVSDTSAREVLREIINGRVCRFADEYDEAREEMIDAILASLPSLSGEWQPIESAPVAEFDPVKWYMPHSPTLLLWRGWTVIGNYGYTKAGKGRWRDQHSNIEPTHWRPLPAPPAMLSATPSSDGERGK